MDENIPNGDQVDQGPGFMVDINLPGLVTLFRENYFVRIFLEIKLYRPDAIQWIPTSLLEEGSHHRSLFLKGKILIQRNETDDWKKKAEKTFTLDDHHGKHHLQ